MKKLKLKALELGATEILTREQMKNVLAGSGSSSNCTCTYSGYLQTAPGVVDPSQRIQQTWSYATNNGSCVMNGSNTYNFGSVSTTINGQYVGTQFFYGVTGSGNINNSINCNNYA
jgi:hypothetical protein